MKEWYMRERGAAQTPVVILPGWGFTGEVLKDHPAFLGRTVIWTPGYTSPDLVASLATFLLENGVTTVELVGWSMGGNMAVDFALQAPELISKLTLVAVRQSWPVADVELTRQELLVANGVPLAKFYRKCFLGAKKDYQQFDTNFLQTVDGLDVLTLSKGLDYLVSHQMPGALPMPVHLFQGGKDLICPAAEMVVFSSQAKKIMLDGAGHFLFSHPKFQL